ncbi:MAG: DoxX family protein [Bryobacterales bacterium]|nr:DoxX family protein [Bryobacterales bacterium]
MKAITERGIQAFTLNALRIVTGFLIAPHGAQKLFGVLGKDPVDSIFSLSGVAGVLEFFGGMALIFGIFTRQVAFVLSGLMAAAYWMAHGTEAFWPIVNQGELAALYCFVFLFLSAQGGGGFSLEGWIQYRR